MAFMWVVPAPCSRELSNAAVAEVPMAALVGDSCDQPSGKLASCCIILCHVPHHLYPHPCAADDCTDLTAHRVRCTSRRRAGASRVLRLLANTGAATMRVKLAPVAQQLLLGRPVKPAEIRVSVAPNVPKVRGQTPFANLAAGAPLLVKTAQYVWFNKELTFEYIPPGQVRMRGLGGWVLHGSSRAIGLAVVESWCSAAGGCALKLDWHRSAHSTIMQAA